MPQDELNSSTYERLLIRSLSGIINGICVLPLEMLKTKVQQSGFIGEATIKRILTLGRKQIKSQGFVKGLYPAFATNLLHYSLVGMITVDIIQRVDQVWLPSHGSQSS